MRKRDKVFLQTGVTAVTFHVSLPILRSADRGRKLFIAGARNVFRFVFLSLAWLTAERQTPFYFRRVRRDQILINPGVCSGSVRVLRKQFTLS